MTKNVEFMQKQIERLRDFAELTLRILELYEEVRVATTRELLLCELHQRLSQLNGTAELKKFRPYLTLLGRLLAELPAHPEHAEAGITCTDQLIAAIEHSHLVQINTTEFSPKIQEA